VSGPHANEPLLLGGAPLEHAPLALVLVHGRGGSAEGMMPIARAAGAVDAAWIAPRAAGNSWYPHRFLSPFAHNEPHLSSAIDAIDRAVQAAVAAGVDPERVLLVGFSQGACLSIEYALRHARRYGGVAALAGAMLGDEHDVRLADGDLCKTPVLLACGDADEHIPVARVEAAAEHCTARGAIVDLRVYPGVGHSVVGDQLEALRAMVHVVRAGPHVIRTAPHVIPT